MHAVSSGLPGLRDISTTRVGTHLQYCQFDETSLQMLGKSLKARSLVGPVDFEH